MSAIRSVIRIAVAGALAAAAACSEPPPPPGEPLAAEERIVASVGGTVASADGKVRLVVPADSLAADATISIHAVGEAPAGDLGGLAPAGPAYRFSPAGTEFSLAEASGMTMAYDREAMVAAGLDLRTVQLHYLDEDSGRYVAVAGRIDGERGEVFGRIEHFTVYLPLARALLPGNNAPTINLQATVPAAARAGAPLAIRATVKDIDAGGSVTGVNLTYTVTGEGPVTVAMTPDDTIGALDTYQYVVPGAAVITGAGNDLTYTITATDNLGAATTSAVTTVDVTRTADVNTLAANPPSQIMASGFSRYFTWTMRDDQNASFTALPDRVEVLGGVGDIIATGSSGVGLMATRVGVGGLRGHIGAASASAQVSVTNGQLTSLQILDQNGMPIEGVVGIRESKQYTFDVVGRDAHGNRVLVSPTWSADANLGGIDIDGVLDTLDGEDIGRVTARVGNVSAVQWVEITPRSLALFRSLIQNFPTLLSDRRALSVFDGLLRVSTLASYALQTIGGGVWVTDVAGGVHGVHASDDQASWVVTDDTGIPEVWRRRVGEADYAPMPAFPAYFGLGAIRHLSLAIGPDHNPWVSYIDGLTDRIEVFRWNGSAWIAAGATANANPNADALEATIAVGPTGTAYLVTSEAIEPGSVMFSVRVKTWDGTDWVQLGNPLDAPAGLPPRSLALEVSTSGTPYAAFMTNDMATLRLMHWNGSTWADVVPAYDVALVGGSVSLALVGEQPYVALWTEAPGDDYILLLYPNRTRTGWSGKTVDTGGVYAGPGELGAHPTALTATPDGTLYVAHSFNDFTDPANHSYAVYIRTFR